MPSPLNGESFREEGERGTCNSLIPPICDVLALFRTERDPELIASSPSDPYSEGLPQARKLRLGAKERMKTKVGVVARIGNQALLMRKED